MMVRLANQFAKNGDAVVMILIESGGSNKQYLSPKVNLVELKCERTLKSLIPLRKQLKMSQPDVILSVLTHINVISALACFSLGWHKRLNVSERNAFSLDKNVNANIVMRAAYAIAPFIYRLLPRPVIAVSQGVADDLVASTILRHSDIVTAPNPVITEDTRKAASQPAKHEWLQGKHKNVIVAVGRLSYQKGFDLLLDAFYKISPEVPCYLIIFGEGELRSQLENQAEALGLKNRVSFAGYSENVITEISKADLFVLSSRFEGSPNALVEAISMGLKIVSFDCPCGPKEILKGHEVKSLVNYLDVNKLSAAMQSQLQEENAADFSDVTSTYTSANSARVYKGLFK